MYIHGGVNKLFLLVKLFSLLFKAKNGYPAGISINFNGSQMFAHLNFRLEPGFKFFTISSGVSWIDLNTVNKANKLNIILMATEYS